MIQETRWCVTFEFDGEEYRWISVEAKHPAAAKKHVLDELGDHVTDWGYVTTTDREQSVQQMLTMRSAEQMGKTLKGIVQAVI